MTRKTTRRALHGLLLLGLLGAGSPALAQVAGACGSAHGSLFTSEPASNLCAAGTPSGVTTNPGTYTWTCDGLDGGSDDHCSATRGFTINDGLVFTDPSAGSFTCVPNPVAYSTSAVCTVAPNPGWYFNNGTSAGGGCTFGAGSWNGIEFTTQPITSNCTLQIQLLQHSYAVTATAGSGGTVTVGSVLVPHGGTASLTVVPDEHFTVNAEAVSGSCPMGSWNDLNWTTGVITGACSVHFSFTRLSYLSYDDGTISCTVPGCVVVDDDGVRTVSNMGLPVPESTESVDVITTSQAGDPDAGVGYQHTVRNASGDALSQSQGSSDVPGSTITVTEDAVGNPRLLMRSELDDETVITVEVRADGRVLHRVTPPGGATSTEVTFSLPGTDTRVFVDGRVQSTVEVTRDGGALRARAVVETLPDGSGVSRFEAYDTDTDTWVLTEATTADISPFAPGHQVFVQEDAGVLLIRVVTLVEQDLYF